MQAESQVRAQEWARERVQARDQELEQGQVHWAPTHCLGYPTMDCCFRRPHSGQD